MDRLDKTVPMMVYKICSFCYGKIWIIIPKLSLLPLLIWSTVQLYVLTNEQALKDLSRVAHCSYQNQQDEALTLIPYFFFQCVHSLKCLNIGTPNTTTFTFVPNGKWWLLDVSIFRHIIIRL